jgi:hypothetical protein
MLTVKYRYIIPGCIVFLAPPFNFCSSDQIIVYMGPRKYRFPISIVLFFNIAIEGDKSKFHLNVS